MIEMEEGEKSAEGSKAGETSMLNMQNIAEVQLERDRIT